MANTRLFDSWQIQKELPAPFDMALANRPRYSTKEEDCSIHNRITRGKKATLFPVVLRALLNLIRERAPGCRNAGSKRTDSVLLYGISLQSSEWGV